MSSQIDSSIPVLTEILTTAVSHSSEFHQEHNNELNNELKDEQKVEKEEKIEALRRKMQNVKMEELMQINQKIEIAAPSQTEMEIESLENSAKWLELETTLRENILRQVLARVDFVLEHKIRDSLAEVLQNSVDKLANDIQLGLKNSIKDVVTRAVTQEIAKIKVNK